MAGLPDRHDGDEPLTYKSARRPPPQNAHHGSRKSIERSGVMLRAIALAFTDLGQGQILGIMLKAIAISIIVFVLIAGALSWLLTGADPCTIGGLGSCRIGIGGSTVGAIALTLLAAWFLFPAVALMVIATFTDQIAAAVERRHYPRAAQSAQRIGVGRGLLLGLKSGARLILFNLVALPFYLLLLVTGVGPFILFVIVNGFAFGRDVAEIAAARHGDPLSRRKWLQSTRPQQHAIGMLISALLLVPFVNLLTPILGTAAGIHLFNGSFWSTRSAAHDTSAHRPTNRPPDSSTVL